MAIVPSPLIVPDNPLPATVATLPGYYYKQRTNKLLSTSQLTIPALVITRIKLLPESATYTLHREFTATPVGRLNFAEVPMSLTAPLVVDPANVLTNPDNMRNNKC